MNGSCNLTQNEQNIRIDWMDKSIELTFNLNQESQEYTLNRIIVEIFEENSSLYNNEKLKLYSIDHKFITPLGLSYFCFRENEFNMTKNEYSNESVRTIKFKHIHFEAFRNDKIKNKFSNSMRPWTENW